MTGGKVALCIFALLAGHASALSESRNVIIKDLKAVQQPDDAVEALAAAVSGGISHDASLGAGPAGVIVAARQRLFDYGVGVVFAVLTQKLQGQRVPDVAKSFSIPIVGSFDLNLSGINVTSFSGNVSSAKLQILDGFFHLQASDLAVNLTFQWHWQKGALSGSGDGELWLSGGTIDYVFDVHKDEELQKPQLQVVTANCNFDSVELKIHSYSADWLYQAVLTLFNEAVKRHVQNGIASALNGDVPSRINAVLASLPTRLEVTGLPFSTTFEYSLYTSGFVVVKGFGEVEVDGGGGGPSPQPGGEAPEPGTALWAAGGGGQQQQQLLLRRRLRALRGVEVAAQGAEAEVGAVGRLRGALGGARAGAGAGARALQQAAGGGGGEGEGTMTRCPFETSPLPLPLSELGADPAMISVYVHENTANCLLWGLYQSGKLTFSLADGTVPGLSITTDVLALLVPQLPTLYPHMRMTINVESLAAPHIAFTAEAGATVSAYYRLGLVVANDTLGNPEVVRLAANLTVSGAFDWDSITIGDVVAHHVVEASQLSVPAEQWDNTVTWLIQNYGPLASLKQLVGLVVKTPVASMVELQAAHATTWDRWYGMSADVEVHLPPAV